ncbi:MAG: hypothetical protein R3E01_10845 [Pirellulaceae bacterium]|nr:hypothetical protein [Planctomycetales bacterium]
MDIVELILRWSHILSAVVLAGGTIGWRVAVVPGLTALGGEQREAFLQASRKPWSMVVGITSGLLLASGLYNAIVIIIRNDFSNAPLPYHALVAVKLLLALVLFFLAARLSGKSSGAVRFRERLTFWLNVNCLLAILLVCLGGLMRLTPRELKAQDAVMETAVVQESLDA